MKIYKYPIPLSGAFELRLPQDSHPLFVQVQYNQPHLWVQLSDSNYHTTERYYVATTGEYLPEDTHRYVVSFQLETRYDDGEVTYCVGHLYKLLLL